MTGVVIFTAGREDAYQDYKQSLKQGHSLEEVERYLTDEEFENLEATAEDGRAHLWGSSVAGKWQNVEPGDIGFVYREGQFVSRGRVLLLSENHALAKHLWKDGVNHERWDKEKPWKYLTFLTGLEETEVDIEDFNELVGYDETYRPQGFTRVADKRLARLRSEYESVETALANLTETGEKVHHVDDEEDEQTPDLANRLKVASTDGSHPDEFEQLVAKTFTRLGCQTNWIEGGGDTDVEIEEPQHIVIEAKSRGDGKLGSLEATNVDKHRRQRGADHAIVVAPGFTPKVIENAETNELTTIAVDDLVELLDRREQYAVPPEQTLDLLTRPGTFQDDRLDHLDKVIQNRVDAGETLLAVIQALEKADGAVETAADVRWIVVGMESTSENLTEADVSGALQLLCHPSIGVVEQDEDGYRVVTNYENAVKLVQSLRDIIELPSKEGTIE